MLVLGEQQASDIIGYLNRDEVEISPNYRQRFRINDVSVLMNKVWDDCRDCIERFPPEGLGSKDYVEGVLKRALGPEKSASVLSRILTVVTQ